MARTLFFTSDLYLTGTEKKALQKQFINPDLCKMQEDFVFANPYMDSPENKWNPLIDAEVQAVRRNGPLKLAIAEMKESYMTHAQALIHGDLHTGSIMLNQTRHAGDRPRVRLLRADAATTSARCWRTWCSTPCRTTRHTPDPGGARRVPGLPAGHGARRCG